MAVFLCKKTLLTRLGDPEEETQKKLNNLYRKNLKLNIWNSTGVNEIFEELLLSKKIKYANKLWNKKLETETITLQFRKTLKHLLRKFLS